MKKRSKKEYYSTEKIEFLRNKAINKIILKFLPSDKIIKIYLIGSSVKNDFGKYEPPGFRNSLYSDFANFSSLGIHIGCIGAICSEKRYLLTKFGMRALLGGTLANLLNAAIASLFL